MELETKNTTIETRRFECKNCKKIWTYAGALNKYLGQCTSCTDPEKELQRFMPWITKLFVKYQISGEVRSKIIRDIMKDHFEKTFRLERLMRQGKI